MKIGYFVSGFPYIDFLTGEITESHYGGGVGVVAYNLTVEMARRGHEIFVITSSINHKNSVEDYGKIKLYRYKGSFKVENAQIPLNLLLDDLRDVDVDVVHAHIGNFPIPLKGYYYAKKWKKPFIVTYHEDYMSGFGSLFRRVGCLLYNHYFADKLLSFADIILTPSKYYISDSKILDRYSDKVKDIPNGINIEEFNVKYSKGECRKKLHLPINKKIILFVGALTYRKAPHILLKTMEKIVRTVPNSFLVIVGEGLIRMELENYARGLGITGHVRFTGAVKDDVKLLYYKSSDIFVLPSFSEGFGIVLLEASAFGLPIIVSNLNVFKTIIDDGYNGLIVKTGNENDLAKKIIYLLKNEEVRKRMGKNAGEKVKEFSWKKIAKKYDEIYYKLIDCKK